MEGLNLPNPPLATPLHPEPEYARMQSFAWIVLRIVEKSLAHRIVVVV